MEQENPGSAVKAKQGRETPPAGKHRELWWVEASIWPDRMVSALGNGVKGGELFSLIDKVTRPSRLGSRVATRCHGTKGRLGWMARALSGSHTNRPGICWNSTRS